MSSKKIAITQRVLKHPSHDEYMDCLDIEWSRYLISLNLTPLPLPLVPPAEIDRIWEALSPDALILSGGNDLQINQNTQEKIQQYSVDRDQFEISLLKRAIKHGKPVFGVCRGLQLINVFYGGELARAEGHVACHHSLVRSSLHEKISIPNIVNSFHNYIIPKTALAKDLEPLAWDQDGNVEAAYNQIDRVLGVMWHPEREQRVSSTEGEIIKKHLENVWNA